MRRPTPKNMAPGRVIRKVERYNLPSGRYREFVHYIVTSLNSQGVYTTDEHFEIVPPLDCSCIPVNMRDIAECSGCGAIVCSDKHAATCPECGKVFCTACLKKIDVDGKQIIVCPDCRYELTTHPALKWLAKIWEMPKK